MSLRGRYIIDRIKRAVSNRLSMPVPPYGNPMFWDNVYKKMETATENMGSSGGDTAPDISMLDDSFEWGGIHLEDVLEYRYRLVTIEQQMGDYASSSQVSEAFAEGSFGETLGVYPHRGYDDERKTDASGGKKEPILMLGCGNSKMGEEMVNSQHQWRGPLIQVDIAKTALEMVARRSGRHADSSRLQFLHEDATHLSSIRNNTIEATVDKGLLDALFCADEHDQMTDIVKSVLRVLKPGGAFVVFSFSRPEFILPRMMPLHASAGVGHPQKPSTWHDLQIQELDRFLIYRFEKSKANDQSGFQEPKRLSRKNQ